MARHAFGHESRSCTIFHGAPKVSLYMYMLYILYIYMCVCVCVYRCETSHHVALMRKTAKLLGTVR